MRRFDIILILLLFPTILLGQEKYKFKYRKHLNAQQSTFVIELEDTLVQADKCTLTFLVSDNKGEVIPFANVNVKSNRIDTLIHSDLNGLVAITVPPDTFSITIFSLQFTLLELNDLAIKANTKTTIKTGLGRSNRLRVALIYSNRKLVDFEIKEIIDDLSNDREEHELIKNKTCYVLWEI